MKFSNILLLYKKSAYTFYFLNKNTTLENNVQKILTKEKLRFQNAHDQHYNSLRETRSILTSKNIKFTEKNRGTLTDYSEYDLIITVGGDGTFLEAAKYLQSHQILIGVNSAPSYSVGRYCLATTDTLSEVLDKLHAGKLKKRLYHRLVICFDNDHKTFKALNDILICHSNPAALSRYYIKMNQKIEEQRSSGIWFSTPTGSTGAIHSAGGKILNSTKKQYQYLPRELYHNKHNIYIHKGGIVNVRNSISITSLMRKGLISIDGVHQSYKFGYGTTATIKMSSKPVKTYII